MKHRLIKLISIIIALTIAWQRIGWAQQDVFCSLRAAAFSQRRPMVDWQSPDEFIGRIRTANPSLKQLSKDEALDVIGHLDGLLDDHNRSIVDIGPLDLMSDLNLTTAITAAQGPVSIVDFEYTDSTYDHVYAIYENGKIVGYGLYNIKPDYSEVRNFRLTILENNGRGNGYTGLGLILAVVYERYAPRGAGITAVEMQPFDRLNGHVHEYAWTTQAPVFFVRAGFEPRLDTAEVKDAISALRRGELTQGEIIDLNAKLFDSSLNLDLRANPAANETVSIRVLDRELLTSRMEEVKVLQHLIKGTRRWEEWAFNRRWRRYPQQHSFVLVNGSGRLVGLCLAYEMIYTRHRVIRVIKNDRPFPDTFLYINVVAVRPEYTRRGLAQQLILHSAKSYADANSGVDPETLRAVIHVDATNPAANNLYEGRLGFEEIGRIPYRYVTYRVLTTPLGRLISRIQGAAQDMGVAMPVTRDRACDRTTLEAI